MYNPYSLEGKVVLVTGAASGIGREVAIECSKLGAIVHIVDNNSVNLSETLSLLEKGQHVAHVTDITIEEEANELVNLLPAIDGFSNCIGVAKTIFIKFLSKSLLDEILRLNVEAPISLIQKLTKKKKFTKQASVVFTSSLAGVYTAHYGDALNATSMGAINAFSKSAALDLSIQGIRVNSVNPGIVATENLFEGTILTEEELKEKQKFFPLHRFGEPKDVALAIIFLLSDASSWITGVSMPVDGGYILL